jgi:ubiquinol-cytochrome c reductase cytochrome c subunit
MKTSITIAAAALALGVLSLNAVSLAAAQAASQPAQAAGAPAAGNADSGKRLFSKIGCYECHGLEAQGATQTAAPRLGPNPITFPAFARYVRKPKGEMPVYTEKVVSDQDLADLYAFVKSRPQPPDPKTLPFPK